MLANVFLGFVKPRNCTGAFLRKEGGIQVLGDLATSSQNSGTLFENLLTCKVGKINLTKSEFDEFTSMEKCIQLPLIEHIRQTQKFGKPSYYVQ
jgi:hypothetical protein